MPFVGWECLKTYLVHFKPPSRKHIEDIGGITQDLGIRNVFRDLTPRGWETKKKNKHETSSSEGFAYQRTITHTKKA